MPRPDGRVEKGQRLKSAISARAWNRAQDAADIVLGVTPGIEAGPLSTIRLPCVKAILRDKGYFGEVRVFDEQGTFTVSKMLPATEGADSKTLAASTAEAKELVRYCFPYTQPSFTVPQDVNNLDFRDDLRFAICVGNDSSEYAIGGFAITRVRVHSTEHRFARLPRDLSSYYSQSANQESFAVDATGCLDSCFWGPARVIGYAMYEATRQSVGGPVPGEGVVFSHSVQAGSQWSNTDHLRWALVKF